MRTFTAHITLPLLVAGMVLAVSCGPSQPSPAATTPPTAAETRTAQQETTAIVQTALTTTPAGITPSPVPPRPASPKELSVVGHLNLATGASRISDIWSLGNYAYLGSISEGGTPPGPLGVHIVDISDPARPARAGFISAPAGARVNDVTVAHLETPRFKGDILVHSNEPAGRGTETEALDADGISIYDVTDPLHPREMSRSFLEIPVHNTFLIQVGDRALVLVVSDGRFIGSFARDFYIVDITDPASPAVLSLTGAPDWGVEQDALGTVKIVGLHEIWARTYPVSLPNPAYSGKTIAYLSYWDAGLVMLDISDPARPVFLGDSEYLDPDPISGQPPEGNSHSAVPTDDGGLVVMGDEDFSPARAALRVDTGPFKGEFEAMELSFTAPLAGTKGREVSGPATFIGSGCDAVTVPSPKGALKPGEVFVALIERGACPVDQKIANASKAGYGAAIVFNSADDPDRLAAIGGQDSLGLVPGVLVTRSTGLALLGVDRASPPGTALPPIGTEAQRATLRSVFDGWGYGRVLDVSNPRAIRELGQFYVQNVFSQTPPPGDHSIHNIMVDGRRAYVAWYADGIRVFDFSDPRSPREIARFVDTVQGSNFWGVYLHPHAGGKTYILGSDIDTGLWIFEMP